MLGLEAGCSSYSVLCVSSFLTRLVVMGSEISDEFSLRTEPAMVIALDRIFLDVLF